MNSWHWEVVHGPARIPSTLPPTDSRGALLGVQRDEERAYCDDLVRRMIEYEIDPVNFFKIQRKT